MTAGESGTGGKRLKIRVKWGPRFTQKDLSKKYERRSNAQSMEKFNRFIYKGHARSVQFSKYYSYTQFLQKQEKTKTPTKLITRPFPSTSRFCHSMPLRRSPHSQNNPRPSLYLRIQHAHSANPNSASSPNILQSSRSYT